VLELTPGKKKINVHASYAIFKGNEYRNRNAIKPEDFKPWVDLAKETGTGLDFNPTFFGHEMVKDGLTLTSPDESVREFWIEHGRACIRIAGYFADELKIPCVLNFWIGDGFKDIPADRLTPRLRYKDSLERILEVKYDPDKVKPCVESKVFGIGVESYTAGSSEFTLGFAASHKGVLPLMDNGHYHPTEVVSDKIPAMLTYFDEIALHITRPVRWDSDHVVLFDDETREMAKEIVRNDALHRVYMALDFFDASINRIGAWAVGFRSWQKALLNAMLMPHDMLRTLQENGEFGKLMAYQEELKTYPFGAVWDEYCRSCNVKTDLEWYDDVLKYEKEVLLKRTGR
ncbi:MAG: L-rhamnose isomerase, partial [Lachnospiraceae bacterium]|nr:L-rhamnose isomerase [Lachnospiraceae bacterium]